MKLKFVSVLAVGALLTAMSASPAQAQFGGLKKAIKKKAIEAVEGKTDDKKSDQSADESSSSSVSASSSPASRPSSYLEIDADVLSRFSTAVEAETAKRAGRSQRMKCVAGLENTPEMQAILMSAGPEMTKLSDSNMSDEKKMAAFQQIGLNLEKKKQEFQVKRCGEAVPELSAVEYETAGAEAGGFTQAQYSMVKERVVPFCTAVAKGSDQAADKRLVYTDSEKAAMKPYCSAMLVALRKIL